MPCDDAEAYFNPKEAAKALCSCQQTRITDSKRYDPSGTIKSAKIIFISMRTAYHSGRIFSAWNKTVTDFLSAYNGTNSRLFEKRE
ncbi:hypothetical protein NPIL_176971 [Nephila pilipes]|uniref:Uncharacterized protein n=1 Tax=Nephila pilipes TaxID=299642 RepID=A0A8X6N4U0_NEPPI|nr:hypothetical protein NPIL_176971 [Nephila pilipes]